MVIFITKPLHLLNFSDNYFELHIILWILSQADYVTMSLIFHLDLSTINVNNLCFVHVTLGFQ